MYFGSYLVRKKIIELDDFVQCATEQLKSNRTLLEVIYEKSILTEEQILLLIDEQYKTRKSLSQIIIERDMIDECKLKEIYETSALLQKSFSDIIKNRSLLTHEEILNHYKSYDEDLQKVVSGDSTGSDVTEISAAALESLKELGEVDLSELGITSQPSSEKNDEPEISAAALESLKELGEVDLSELGITSQSSSEQNDEPEISAAALESLKELGEVDLSELGITSQPSSGKNDEPEMSAAPLESLKELDPSFTEGLIFSDNNSVIKVNVFLKLFNDNLYSKLKKIIDIIFLTSAKGGDFCNFFNSLLRVLYILKDSSKDAGLSKMNSIFTGWEEGINFFFSLDENDKKRWLGINGDDLVQIANYCWSLRNKIDIDKNEDSIERNMVDEVDELILKLRTTN